MGAAGEIFPAIPGYDGGSGVAGLRFGRRLHRLAVHQLQILFVLRGLDPQGLPRVLKADSGLLKPAAGVLRRVVRGGAQLAPDGFVYLHQLLKAGADGGGDPAVELRSRVGAHRQLHNTDAEQGENQDKQNGPRGFKRSFIFFHVNPQKNKNNPFHFRQKRLYYKWRDFETIKLWRRPHGNRATAS